MGSRVSAGLTPGFNFVSASGLYQTECLIPLFYQPYEFGFMLGIGAYAGNEEVRNAAGFHAR
jgi:hypothetical protein